MSALFDVGQTVRIASREPGVHHRVPAYAKGQVGFVERICGQHGRPETLIRGDGQPFERLYRIRIPQTDLWPDYQGSDRDCLDIEVFEHWLEAVE